MRRSAPWRNPRNGDRRRGNAAAPAAGRRPGGAAWWRKRRGWNRQTSWGALRIAQVTTPTYCRLSGSGQVGGSKDRTLGGGGCRRSVHQRARLLDRVVDRHPDHRVLGLELRSDFQRRLGGGVLRLDLAVDLDRKALRRKSVGRHVARPLLVFFVGMVLGRLVKVGRLQYALGDTDCH